MQTLHIVLFVVMLAVVLVLFAGLGLMMKGGTVNEKYGNKFMVARVCLQGLAVLLLGLLFVMAGASK